LNATLDEEMEQTWNFEEVYISYRENLVNERMEQSRKWFSTVKPDISSIDGWTLAQCQKQLVAMSDLPKFLSTKHAEEIETIAKQIRQKTERLKEQERASAALNWIEGIHSQVKIIDELSSTDCEKLLRTLEKLPEFVSEKEMHQVVELRSLLTQRQDTLDIKSILERICSLKEDLRLGLFEELGKLYSYK
jgi:DNA mismatch repair ATPase MutL